jgi:phthalate 4,5-dioxygenase oxygenase subunit
MIRDCNWMQVLEGSIDSSHVGILHLDTLATMGAGPRSVGSFDFAGEPWDLDMPTPPKSDNPWPSHDNAPKIEVEDTPFGFHYAALREAADGADRRYVRITAFVMPYTSFVGGTNGAVIVVPRDDHTCSSLGIFKVPKGMGGAAPAGAPRKTIDPDVWGPEPENRRLRVPPQDREAMKDGLSFAGFRGGNRVQDGAVQMSSGPLYDRTKEHLVPADLAIIRLRRLLTDSIRLVEEGKPPLGLGVGFDFSGVGGASALVEASTAWQDLVPGNAGSRAETGA